jgi:hypothetical protein
VRLTAAAATAAAVLVLRRSRPVMKTPDVSSSWQLDFYSRPVQGPDGKKLWELLVIDDTGSFQHVETVPSNCVNSRELRSRVQRLIADAPVQPTTIRFFRAQMQNMITIALKDLPNVDLRPSRRTYTLCEFIEDRERNVYSQLPGYRKPRPEPEGLKLAGRLPDNLRGEKYAVATLPYCEFSPGGSVTGENIGFGALCSAPAGVLPPDSMVAGVVIFSKRAEAIAAYLSSLELAFVSARLDSRELHVEVDLDTQYLLARLRTPTQVLEAESLEKQKFAARGLHFLAIQTGPEAEQPEGFWLLRDIEVAARAAAADAPAPQPLPSETAR